MSKESAVRNNIWKWLVLLLIAVVSFYVTTPVQEKLRFGLDLKGGTSFTLGVDTERLAESIIAENPAITNTPGAVQAKIDETLKDCDSRIIEVIRRRVDAMGTNEPVIQGMKDHRLLVQLPGVDEEVRKAAKASLQSAAYLEFRLTHAKNDQLVAKLLSKDVAPEGYVKKDSAKNGIDSVRRNAKNSPVVEPVVPAEETEEPVSESSSSAAAAAVTTATIVAPAQLTLAAFIENLYSEALGRQADETGMNHWLTEYEAGNITVNELVEGIFLSEEYLSSDKTDEEFLTDLYHALLRREPDEKGMEHWLDCLASGMEREEVIDGFVDSEEFAAIAASYGLSLE